MVVRRDRQDLVLFHFYLFLFKDVVVVIIRSIVKQLFKRKHLTVPPLLFKVDGFPSESRSFFEFLLKWIWFMLDVFYFNRVQMIVIVQPVVCIYVVQFASTQLGSLGIFF